MFSKYLSSLMLLLIININSLTVHCLMCNAATSINTKFGRRAITAVFKHSSSNQISEWETLSYQTHFACYEIHSLNSDFFLGLCLKWTLNHLTRHNISKQIFIGCLVSIFDAIISCTLNLRHLGRDWLLKTINSRYDSSLKSARKTIRTRIMKIVITLEYFL